MFRMPVTADRRLFLVGALMTLACHRARTENAEEEVKKAILRDYDRTSRPFPVYPSSPVVTYITVMLRSFEIDEFHLSSTINAWVVMNWRDPRLAWQPSDHGDVYVVMMTSQQIWLPDIVLINGVSHLEPTFMHVPVPVSSHGSVVWVTPSTFRVRCLNELASWPYDQQNCTIILSSWSLDTDSHQVEPAAYDGKLVTAGDMIQTESHWKAVDVKGYLVNGTYSAAADTTWHELFIELHVARVSMLYAVSFILPCVALAIHILVVFWLPPDSSAKIKVCTIHSVALVFFLINLFWFMPPVGGNTVPKVVSFAGGSLSLSVVSCLAAVLAANLVTRVSPPPAPLLALYSGVAGVVLRLGDLNQQMQSTKAPFAEDGVPVQDKEAQKAVRRAEWLLVATGLDRSFFLAQLVIFVLLVLSCLA
ncbi:acetylcholine receptor subunit beta-type acr-2-like [Pollicipes pollicipes]|uniref:acetylcholine receptor subunit beta-type acr-2-like n=1 Tax=Pollicipes pollicipes TaxID=41117 RepID=UPI001884ED98|nr:acetylcholine receptor subunit beta-type acr-2-like [Pollicipes pollicipes]